MAEFKYKITHEKDFDVLGWIFSFTICVSCMVYRKSSFSLHSLEFVSCLVATTVQQYAEGCEILNEERNALQPVAIVLSQFTLSHY